MYPSHEVVRDCISDDLGLTWGSFPASHFTASSLSRVSCVVQSSSSHLHSSAIVDSGATGHFTARADLLRDAVPLSMTSEVFMANSAPLSLIASGTLLDLPGSCYLAPDISNSLISVPRLDEAGPVTIIKSGTLISGTLPVALHPLLEQIMRALWSLKHCALFASLTKGLYRADLDNLRVLPHSTQHNGNIALYPRFHCSTLRDLVCSCHEAWGHMSQADMLTLVRNASMPGIPPLLTPSAIRRNWHICKACVEGTFAVTPLPHHSSLPSTLTFVGELVCVDGFGKISPPSYSGHQYWVISVCAFSHYVYCHLVKSRSEYPDAVVGRFYYLPVRFIMHIVMNVNAGVNSEKNFLPIMLETGRWTICLAYVTTGHLDTRVHHLLSTLLNVHCRVIYLQRMCFSQFTR